MVLSCSAASASVVLPWRILTAAWTASAQQQVLPPGSGNGPRPVNGAGLDISTIRERALLDPRIDSACPGKLRSSQDIGAECWARLWALAGCRAENVPPYERWHQAQSLEGLVSDVVLWANLDDERHRQGCYGTMGPPLSEQAASPSSIAAQRRLQASSGPPVAAREATAVNSLADVLAIVQNGVPRPVILEFWSEACGFCTIMFPVFELLAAKYKGRAYFLTVDVQRVPEAADVFQVMGLPAFKAVMLGQVVAQVDGADTGGLERLVAESVAAADRQGVQLPRQNLLEFLQRQDPDLIAGSPERVEEMVAQASADLPGLLGSLEAQYNARPQTTGGYIPGMEHEDAPSSAVRAGARLAKADAADLSDEELLAEVGALQQELWRREAASAGSAWNSCAEARTEVTSSGAGGSAERLLVLGGRPAWRPRYMAPGRGCAPSWWRRSLEVSSWPRAWTWRITPGSGGRRGRQ